MTRIGRKPKALSGGDTAHEPTPRRAKARAVVAQSASLRGAAASRIVSRVSVQFGSVGATIMPATT